MGPKNRFILRMESVVTMARLEGIMQPVNRVLRSHSRKHRLEESENRKRDRTWSIDHEEVNNLRLLYPKRDDEADFREGKDCL